MQWPNPESIFAALPEGYSIEQLRRQDVHLLIDAIRGWYPTIVVGAESAHLDSEFYETRVALAEPDEKSVATTDRRSVYVVVLRHRGAIVGVTSFEYDSPAKALFARLVIVAPEHRGAALAVAIGPAFGDALAHAIGAEIAMTTTTLSHSHGQRILEGAGFKLAGIIPGFDRDQIGDGVIKRVYEAVYIKLYVDEAELVPPEREHLLPSAAALMDFLYPRR